MRVSQKDAFIAMNACLLPKNEVVSKAASGYVSVWGPLFRVVLLLVSFKTEQDSLKRHTHQKRARRGPSVGSQVLPLLTSRWLCAWYSHLHA